MKYIKTGKSIRLQRRLTHKELLNHKGHKAALERLHKEHTKKKYRRTICARSLIVQAHSVRPSCPLW